MKYKKDSRISTDLINWIKKSISCWAENLVVHEIEHNLQSTYLGPKVYLPTVGTTELGPSW